jgi:hypothetical protein
MPPPLFPGIVTLSIRLGPSLSPNARPEIALQGGPYSSPCGDKRQARHPRALIHPGAAPPSGPPQPLIEGGGKVAGHLQSGSGDVDTAAASLAVQLARTSS